MAIMHKAAEGIPAMSKRTDRAQEPIVKQGWGSWGEGVWPPQVGTAQENTAKVNN